MNPAGAALLSWFDAHRRDLPWRRTGDPYQIWVAEVMLQQTRVETVLPYYRAFLARFPEVKALADAPMEEVLALWSGLGYYRRARQMHEAARRIVAAGGFPRTLEGLRKLPGIGPYTAAAVASMAFGVAAPVLDGNVERVLCRFLAVEGNPRRAGRRRQLLEAAGRLLDPRRPGDSNQALMELGATVCVPRRPQCPRCPLRPWCRAAAAARPEAYPEAQSRRPAVFSTRVVVLVEGPQGILLFRRPESSRRLAGIWELPWVEVGEDAVAAERELARRYGGCWRLGPELGEVRHAITFHSLRLLVRRGVVEGEDGVGEGPEAGWFRRQELSRLPLAAMVRKILGRVDSNEG